MSARCVLLLMCVCVCVGGVWGDAGLTAHLEASLRSGDLAKLSHTRTDTHTSVTQLNTLAQRLIDAGLKCEPANDALWALAGDVAAAQAAAAVDTAGTEQLVARAEACLTRALQLNSARGPAWAALARLYARHGQPQLAAAAAERCRLVDPRLVAVWEAMAALSGQTSKVRRLHVARPYWHTALSGF